MFTEAGEKEVNQFWLVRQIPPFRGLQFPQSSGYTPEFMYAYETS